MRTRRSNLPQDADSSVSITDMSPSTISLPSVRLSVRPRPQGSSTTNTGISEVANAEPRKSGQGVEAMGHGVKELLSAINKLEELGMDKLVVNLPKIVAIGDQSAGKSSTIEAISQIRVPRSTGTCTRCPFHLNLTHVDDGQGGSSWSCTVEIHHKYSFEGVQRGRAMSGPFPGWRLNHQPLITHFQRTHDQDAVEEILRRAQFAVLNPNTDPRKYAEKIEVSTSLAVEFSPNPIVINITGPHLPDLSLVDLPGVITQTEDGKNTHLPKVVQNLVKDYITPKNTVILLACSMEGDIANSNASSLLRKIRAENRTVGILTKPDRLPKGDPVDLWQAILAGRKYPLKHAYYVTKQPSQAEMSFVDHAQARRDEEHFFESEQPWCTELASFSAQFGTRKLQERLSALLASTISANLPEIRAKIDERILVIDRELSQIPEPPSANAVHVVLSHLDEFVSAVSTAVDGLSPKYMFRNEWKDIKSMLSQDLFALRPKLRMVCAEKPKEEGANMSVIELSDGEPDNDRAPEPVTPKKRRLNQEAVFTPKRSNAAVRGMSDLARKFSPGEIKKIIKHHSTSDMPTEVDPRATEFLVLECLTHWGLASSRLFNALKRSLDGTMRQVFEDVLGKFATTELYTKTWDHVENFVSLHFGLQFGKGEGACDRLLQLETYRPLTENETAWKYNRDQELEIFRAARYRHRAMAYFDKVESSTGKQVKLVDRERKIENDAALRSQLGEDPDEVEVQLMAKVRGYYNIASSRFCDNVCMSVQGELFKALRTGLKEELLEGLNATDQNACIRLLAEDPEREARRQDLKQQRESLTKATQVLDSLTLKYRDDNQSDATMEADEVDEDEDNISPSPSNARARHCAHRASDTESMDMEA
ncbi:hypothetical protein EJ05DRAFT_282772 [Pseudovirgaria hyperparasitica]|uniref:P-loop containing nucleoside triphosphate hydrolase protein n=1 Tax=Pseudovirgaria hyperparasitica TaxID=470096 RepID=A0A6A6WDX4_9PEZI|nr:uncharacterized protein EJ05DRAFT_282772 [Pseudovirgaria hyperparasitica]KAF2760379.1 hypothetical protein EJ05DRAFT_282772 [Pseudovirgaria hyperparasitica]